MSHIRNTSLRCSNQPLWKLNLVTGVNTTKQQTGEIKNTIKRVILWAKQISEAATEMSWKKDVLINNLVPSSFHLRKKPVKNTIFSNFFIRWKPQETSGNATESCRLSACNFTKTELLCRFFKDFDCKFQSTYFPEHLLSSCFCRGVFRTLSRWSFFVNIINDLKPLTIFTKKLHLRCFTRFCVRLCSEVTSSIYQTYKFKVYCNSFWRHCNVFDVVFARINETLCPLSDVMLSKNLELLCDCMFATNTKTIIYIT